MARTVIVQLVDDLDGSPADETVSFGLDGVRYSIDLSSENALKLREALAPFVEAARVEHTPKRRRIQQHDWTPSEVRSWAVANGIKVADRGRIPGDVVVRYLAAK